MKLLLPVALLAFFAFSDTARAQKHEAPHQALSADAKPGHPGPRPGLGHFGREVAGAFAGDAVGVVLNLALIANLQLICIDGNECSDDDDKFLRRQMGGLAVRPLLIGSFTAWLGNTEGGVGRMYAPIIASVPGVALIATGYWVPGPRALWIIGSGHLLAVAGAVAGYRLSARNQVAKLNSTTASLTPGAYADRNGFGISLSGRF